MIRNLKSLGMGYGLGPAVRTRRKQRIQFVAVTLIGVAALTAIRPSGGTAQILYGRITDNISGTPVVSATVTVVLETANDSITVLSDSIGRYSITLRGPGRYSLRARRLGYQAAVTEALQVNRGELMQLDIKLTPAGLELPAIQVLGRSGFEPARLQFARRCELATGICLNAARVALRQPRVALDALRAVDGLAVSWDGSAGYSLRTFNGECLMVFLNNSIYPAIASRGGRLPRAGVFDSTATRTLSMDLNMIDPKSIMGVEIYLNYHDIPRELRESMLGFALWPANSRPCGAAIIWTRAAW